MWRIFRVLSPFLYYHFIVFRHVRDILSVLEAMLKTKISLVPGSLLSVYIQNIAKLYSVLLLSYEKDDDFDNIESLDNLMLSKLPEFEYADDLEAQERVKIHKIKIEVILY